MSAGMAFTVDVEAGCGECPLFRSGPVNVCLGDRRERDPIDEGVMDEPAPEWCVLRTGWVSVIGKPPEPCSEEREDAAPLCPQCGSVTRERRRGSDGQPFWGCSKFPACRGIVNQGARG